MEVPCFIRIITLFPYLGNNAAITAKDEHVGHHGADKFGQSYFFIYTFLELSVKYFKPVISVSRENSSRCCFHCSLLYANTV